LRPGVVPAVAFEPLRWSTTQPLVLPGGLGRLRLEHRASCEPGMLQTAMGETGTRDTVMGEAGIPGLAIARLTSPLEVRARRGGESLRPAGDTHRRTLKKLLQSRGVLPWWRPHVPLIYSAGRLAAVADLWIAQEFAAGEGEPSARIVWDGAPDLLSSTGRLG
jgi:tRNA(Ile)-lysidine synthase